MRKREAWILIWHHSEVGKVIFCQDGKWRRCPDYGTYNSCAKVWSSKGWAMRKARHWQRDWEVVRLSEQSE